MGIQLHQHQIGVLFSDGGHSTGADRMLTAQHQRPEAQGEHRLRWPASPPTTGSGLPEGNVHGTEVGKGQILQIQVQLRAIGFQALADLTDGGWSKRVPGRKEVVPS